MGTAKPIFRARPNGGTPPDAFASDGFAHPTNWLDRTRHSYPPYRRVANLRNFFRQSVAAAASLAVTHPPRESRLVPHEKNVPQFCLQFVSTKSQDANVASAAGANNRMQVVHPATDFARPRVATARAMALKRLN